MRVASKSDVASLINDGTSSGQSEPFSPPITSSARRRRNRKHDSTEPTELDLLLLTDQMEALRRDLEQEQRLRQEDMKLAHRAIQRVYNDCIAMNGRESSRLSTVEQKVETVTGRYRGCHEEIRTLKKQIDNIITTASSLRTRVEELEQRPRNSLPPVAQPIPSPGVEQQLNLGSHAGSTAGKAPRKDFWSAQVIFVLNAQRPNVFEVDGVAYLKLQSRSSRQKVLFSSGSALSFVLGVEGSFPNILRNRSWMPLASHRLADIDGHARITLDRLPAKQRESDLWDHSFLEQNCVTYDASGKAHIYVALQRGELTLRELSGATTKLEDQAAAPSLRQQHSQPMLTTTSASTPGPGMPMSAAMSPVLGPTPLMSTNASARVSARNSHELLQPSSPRLGEGTSSFSKPSQPQRQSSLQALPPAAQTMHSSNAGAASLPRNIGASPPAMHSQPFRNWTLHASQRTSYEPPKSNSSMHLQSSRMSLSSGGVGSTGEGKKQKGFFGSWLKRNTSSKGFGGSALG